MTLKSPEARASLKTFACAALECVDPEISELKFERFRLHNGVAFELSNAALDAQSAFIRLAGKKLGPKNGHAKVVDKAIWDFVVEIDDESKLSDTAYLNTALEQIEAKSSSVCEFFRPCPLIHLPEAIDRIEIGRVAIERAQSRLDEFRKINDQSKFGIGNDWTLSIVVATDEVGIVTKLPPTLWSINLEAADPLREEEGLWLTDVALSILRLAVKRDDLGVMAPTIGKVEPHPFHPHISQDHSFTVKQEGGGQLGGMSAPNDYRLTEGAVKTLSDEATQSKIQKVFESKPKSLAERFYQGCGWLTRGRRSADRSDRLLYFFTAIESLLSDSDKTSPVIQTIARHAAALLSEENESRHRIASDIKKLYGVRSALVHTGSRGAFDIDANSAQQIAELLFFRVWCDFDLAQRHNEFSAKLAKASFGLPVENGG